MVVVIVAGHNDFLFECFAHVITWNPMVFPIVGIFATDAVTPNEICGTSGIGPQVNAAAETQTSKIFIETVAFVRFLLFGAVFPRQCHVIADIAVLSVKNARAEAIATIQWCRCGATVFSE